MATKKIHFDKQVLVINPGDFFFPEKMQNALDDLNDFLKKTMNVELKKGSDKISQEKYLYPFIQNDRGYFMESGFAPDGWIRGKSFEIVLRQLGCMIAGEKALTLMAHDRKERFIFNHAIETNEFFPIEHLTSTVAFRTTIPICRVCGTAYPLKEEKTQKTKKPAMS